jgi:hypothetical protein
MSPVSPFVPFVLFFPFPCLLLVDADPVIRMHAFVLLLADIFSKWSEWVGAERGVGEILQTQRWRGRKGAGKSWMTYGKAIGSMSAIGEDAAAAVGESWVKIQMALHAKDWPSRGGWRQLFVTLVDKNMETSLRCIHSHLRVVSLLSTYSWITSFFDMSLYITHKYYHSYT